MAKLVDAPASGAGDRKVVGVRVPSWAPNTSSNTSTPYMGSNQPITRLPLNQLASLLELDSHGAMQNLGFHLIPKTFKVLYLCF